MADDFDIDSYLAGKSVAVPDATKPGFDIDAYLAGKGTNTAPVEPKTPEMPEPTAADTAADAAKSLGVGVGEGAIGLAGGAGTTRELLTAGGEKVGLSPQQSKFIMGHVPVLGPLLKVAPSVKDIQGKIEEHTGKFYEPKTEIGGYAKSIGQMVPGALAGPGGVARNLALGAVVPGAASEAAGNLPGIKGTEAEPWVRGAAAVVAPTVVGRAISPFNSPATRRASVDALEREGVTDISAGQRTGNKRLQYQEAEMSPSAAASLMERQSEQFTRAAARRAGINEPRLTSEVIDNNFNRLGQIFDNVEASTTLNVNRAFLRDLTRARDRYERLVAPNQRVPVINDHIQDIAHQAVQNLGAVPGNVASQLRTAIGVDIRAVAGNYQAQNALREIENVVSTGIERSLRGSGNAQLLGQWRQARREYRNMVVLERAISRQGEAAAAGILTPAHLAGAVKSLHGVRGFIRGQGDLAGLARTGQEVLSPLPNSGTAQRMRSHVVPAIIGGILGGSASLPMGMGHVGAGLGATLGGIALPSAMGHAVLSAPMRRFLANRALQERDNPGSAAMRGYSTANPWAP